MTDLKRTYKMRDQYDNCYHEAKRRNELKSKHPVVKKNRSQQTNLLEMLGIDNLTSGGRTDYDPYMDMASTQGPSHTQEMSLPSYRDEKKSTERKPPIKKQLTQKPQP